MKPLTKAKKWIFDINSGVVIIATISILFPTIHTYERKYEDLYISYIPMYIYENIIFFACDKTFLSLSSTKKPVMNLSLNCTSPYLLIVASSHFFMMA